MKVRMFILITVVFAACRFVPSDNTKSESYLKEGPAFNVLLNPEPGSVYRYTVNNKTDVQITVDDQEVVSKNHSDMSISYNVAKDTAGDFVLSMKYEKIKLRIQKDKEETELDADNASFSMNMLEKMLGGLKESTFDVQLKPNGMVKNIQGFSEAGDRVFRQIQFKSIEETRIARELWDKTIEANMVRQNVDQFFRIFPDSSVHLREKWTITHTQQGEFNLKTTTTYFVKAITEEKIFIESVAVIASEKETDMSAQNTADIKGEQTGEYVLELKTGMLLSAKLSADLKGTVKMQGVEAPLKIKSVVTMDGAKAK
ncbi:MAG: hypothetical protein GXC73_13060 [Chitinophagaceae bacterium]|nr:hypothetical protein [Chitinophagaceae bacterium]